MKLFTHKRVFVAVALAMMFNTAFASGKGVFTSSEGFWGVVFNASIKITVDATNYTDPFLYFEEGDRTNIDNLKGTGKANKSWAYCMANRTQYQREYLSATNKWQWTIKFFPYTYATFFNLTGAERFLTDGFTIYIGSNEFPNKDWTEKEFFPIQYSSDALGKGDTDGTNPVNPNNGSCIVTSATEFHPTRTDLQIINTAEPFVIEYWTLYADVKSNPRFYGINSVYDPGGQGTGRELTLIETATVWTRDNNGAPAAERSLARYKGEFDLNQLVLLLGGNSLEQRVNALTDQNQQVRMKLSSTVNPNNANADFGRNYWITYQVTQLDSCHIIPQNVTVEIGDTYNFSAIGLDASGTAINAGITYGFEIVGSTTNTITPNGVFTANASGTFTVKCTAWQNSTQTDKYGYATIAVAAASIMDNVTVTPSSVPSLQLGTTQQFTAQGFVGTTQLGSAGLTFTWSILEATSNLINTTTGLFTANQLGTYTVKVVVTQTATGTQLTATAQVTVQDLILASVAIFPSSARIDFLGEKQQFSAVAKNSSGAVITNDIIYQWEILAPTGTNTITPNGEFTGNEVGVFWVKCIATQGTVIVSETAVIVVENNRLAKLELEPAIANITYLGGTAQFTPTAKTSDGIVLTNGINFVWEIIAPTGTNTISQSGLFTGNEIGDFTVKCTSTQVATGATATATAIVKITTTGFKEIETNKYSIFPNPVLDILNIKGLEKDADIRIVDVMGRVVISQSTSGTVNISNLSQGLYILFVNNSVIRFLKR